MIIFLINDYILQTDYTSGHATKIQSQKIHQRFNAKLSRAISFATNGQVEYSEKYCYYTVVDENRKPWIVHTQITFDDVYTLSVMFWTHVQQSKYNAFVSPIDF